MDVLVIVFSRAGFDVDQKVWLAVLFNEAKHLEQDWLVEGQREDDLLAGLG